MPQMQMPHGMQMPQMQQQMQTPLGYVCVPMDMLAQDGGVKQDTMTQIEQFAQHQFMQMGITQVTTFGLTKHATSQETTQYA